MFEKFFTYFQEFDRRFQKYIDDSGGRYQRILYTPPEEVNTAYHRDVANTKRFLEYYVSCNEYRQRCMNGEAQQLADEFGIDVDAEAIRLLWDNSLSSRRGAYWLYRTPEVARYQCFLQEKILHRTCVQEEEAVPANNVMRLWRERQIKRLLVEMGPSKAEAVIHTPFNIELSDGCSVGCWFCGVNAGEKGDDFSYTPENAGYWRELLRTVKEVVGPGAVTGTCYYATEPMDNPNYEDFCKDYAEILGHFPQTTTAASTRDIERTRKLLTLSRKYGTSVNRFSVLSLPMFEKIMSSFTPLELLYVELLMQNVESISPFALAGRAVKNKHVLDKTNEKVNSTFNEESSIACATGFRLNIVKRTVKLVTPKPAKDDYPDGELVYETATFSDIDSLRENMLRMIETYLPVRLLPRDPVAFSPFAKITLEGKKIHISTGATVQIIDSPVFLPCYDYVRAGNMSAIEIAEKVSSETDYTEDDVLEVLNEFFESGILNEDPEFFKNKTYSLI